MDAQKKKDRQKEENKDGSSKGMELEKNINQGRKEKWREGHTRKNSKKDGRYDPRKLRKDIKKGRY